MHYVGLFASLPPATVQRIRGGRAGLAVDRARGIDPRPVAPRTLPTSTSVTEAA
ncbi:hypothetical protein ACFYXF_35015 [Streptomyces sp. NPDC002680]|uniref:hypothetical protein n=1 Tax=Streptomyces sp. NPDC002680 TaxID=3364659 RepID=UPI0036A50847